MSQGEVGISVSTGYNWGEVSTEAQSETREFEVSTEVPGGRTIQIQQTKGECGGSNVNTEMFRSVVTNRAGKPTVTVL